MCRYVQLDAAATVAIAAEPNFLGLFFFYYGCGFFLSLFFVVVIAVVCDGTVLRTIFFVSFAYFRSKRV